MEFFKENDSEPNVNRIDREFGTAGDKTLNSLCTFRISIHSLERKMEKPERTDCDGQTGSAMRLQEVGRFNGICKSI